MNHQATNQSNEKHSDSADLPIETASKSNAMVIGIVSIIIVAAGIFAYKYLDENKIEAQKSPVIHYTPTVDVIAVKRVSFTPTIKLQGEVRPSTQTDIISEVTGVVVEMSDKLEVGKIFEAGEVVLRINDADYRTQLANAQATLADAELLLAQEQARAVQSIRDWEKLGKGRPASDLVRRVPQIKSAKARIAAAQAAVDKATRDIQKTIIRAPYRCIVHQKFIDQGAYLSALTKIASVYSVTDYEVRLPVSLDEINFLPVNNGLGKGIRFSAQIGGETLTWSGEIDRVEGGIDTQTFSMVIVGSVQPNPDQGLFTYPPKGLFINAGIKGRKLENVIKLPRLALRDKQKIWVLSDINTLTIADAEIVREESENLYIKSEILDGTNVIVSPIAVPVKGMKLERTKPKPAEKTAQKPEGTQS